MNPAQCVQQSRIEALRSHAEPINARRAQSPQLFSIERAGIGLQRNFCVLVKRKSLVAALQQARDLLYSQQAGCTAAKKERTGTTRITIGQASHLTSQGNLVEQRPHIGFAQREHARVGIEIAVMTAGMTERNMQVERNRLQQFSYR